MATFSYWDTATIIGMVVVYIVITSLISIRLRSRNSEQFMVAGRSMPALVVAILLMSEFIGAKSTVGTSQEAFSAGIAASWSVLAAAIGFLLFGLFMAKRLYASGEFTISGFIAQRYGHGAKLAVSAIMIYALFVVNVGNYVSGAAAISTVMRINLPTAAVITAIVSTIYFVWGGLKSVAYLTIVHSAVKLLGIAILVGVAWKLSGGIAPMARSMPAHYFTWTGALSGGTIGAWIIGTAGAIFSTQFIIQAISATRSPEGARASSLIAAFLCVPIALALGFIGVAAKYLYPGVKSLYALPVFLQHMNPILAGIVTTSLVASIFVSVCTVALAIASLIVKDFYVPRFNPTPDVELRMTRWISLVVGFLPLIFVLFVPQILALSFFSRALRLSVSVVALIGIYLPFFSGKRGAVSALIVATLATTLWYLVGNPFGIDNMYVALVTPAVVLAIGKLLFHGDGANLRDKPLTHRESH
ncbi:sodium:solute symporter family protein [Burkholderia cenocepacia]|jgi:SSS family solute:Na+ symporter|uniref:Sodium:solute symporter n=1 Tax=Burkholderia cenocepacia TaxID=95486 RepID=A0A1V2W222_9BURK|nr:sodium:solute symporter family protein [Burkholderia cenocepacia]MBR8250260.1 sodium:solute symporter family protein [Burkholderia cenocepacia]MBR8266183.1 sodium:solute symporter family protein [Burkholderia cenocepacia]MBR8286571.1 sodium:solute symporter family protein [Burkholderia cenocepacia]MBR8500438.1 sodium:solute symporter family protein [Burkholderia cenocepacia]MDV3101374.1 sodium:solute symporter family protein [Burkholderia cenocepacia]